MLPLAHRFAKTSVGLVVLAFLAAPAFAGGGRGGFNATQIRSRLLANVQTQVGFTDEEWTVVEPKLWKIVQYQAETGTGVAGNLVNQVRGIGGGGGVVNNALAQIFGTNGQPSQVTTKLTELQNTLDRQDSSAAEIRVKLDEYRAAVTRSKTQLTAAQAELTNILTVRQEGMLTALGYL